MSRSWYAFIGDDNVTDVSKYFRVTVKHQCLCGDKICAIYAKGIGTHPDAPLSENMQSYIKAALINCSLQPENPVGSKKYVYLKK